jgi:hypothetical protein
VKKLECRHCGAAIAAADVHAELAIARCARCSAITDLAGGAAAGARRAPAPLPAELEVEEGPGTLHLSWRSSSFKRFVALALCVLLLGSFSEVWPRVAFAIDTGPYHHVRHPGYVGIGLGLLGWPLLLGSAWSFTAAGAALAWLVLRTLPEDRTLHRELAGYADYARRVRWRLVPGVR